MCSAPPRRLCIYLCDAAPGKFGAHMSALRWQRLPTSPSHSLCAQVSFALAKAALDAAGKRGTKRKADGDDAPTPEPVTAPAFSR